MVNVYPVRGYQMVNAVRQLAAGRQFFSGRNGNILGFDMTRARDAHVRGGKQPPIRPADQKNRGAR
ncbi:hypothetical protein [Sphingobium sp. CCH11-B1]|jgi:hypothetical protein|uniref:hypothetical protein n=1 Tax=Sphingobium sp. CCH11-B1 TaxID=1768781 RepID=UPI0012E3B352|nr:hypothetical protein [Sphingobium sp. CCH11-B1]